MKLILTLQYYEVILKKIPHFFAYVIKISSRQLMQSCLTGGSIYHVPNCLSLIRKPVHVILQPVHWEGALNSEGTVWAALARLDHHHVLDEGFPIITMELHGQGSSLLWVAAPSIQAWTTIFWPVFFHAAATCVRQLHWLLRFFGATALLPSLKKW